MLPSSISAINGVDTYRRDLSLCCQTLNLARWDSLTYMLGVALEVVKAMSWFHCEYRLKVL